VFAADPDRAFTLVEINVVSKRAEVSDEAISLKLMFAGSVQY